MTTKTCKACEIEKDLSCFYQRQGRTQICYSPSCKLCASEKSKERHRKNYKPSKRIPQFDTDTQNGFKICTKCQKQQPLKNFSWEKLGKAYCSRCRNCFKKPPKPKPYAVFEKDSQFYKKCRGCKITKNIDEYNKVPKNKNSTPLSRCKKCQSIWHKQNLRKTALENLDCWKEEYQKRKERLKNNPEAAEKFLKRRLRQQAKDREKCRLRAAEIRKTPHRKQYMLNYVNKRRAEDIHFRLRRILSTRIHHALQGLCKSARTIELLGCEIQNFKQHMESQFKPGMTWENYGFGQEKWVIDHIIPCRAFDLSKLKEQKRCFHFSNLQPLWNIDNIVKNDKMPNGTSARLIFAKKD